MVTPLEQNTKIDKSGVENVVEGLVKNQCNAFILGTTGEASSLATTEKTDLVKYTVECVRHRNLVYAGISGNCLEESVEIAKKYADLGVDVLVAHLPCYYGLDTDQMLRYYELLAERIPLPLVLYNIPITTNLSIPLEIIDQLSHHEKIVGFKDSQRGEERLSEALKLWKNRTDFAFHLGWAAMSSYAIQNGLDGIVPSSANLVPGLYRSIYDAARKGNMDEAYRLQSVGDDISAYYQEGKSLSRAFPILKTMMDAFGLCKPWVAPPMLNLSKEEQKSVKAEVLELFGEYKD